MILHLKDGGTIMAVNPIYSNKNSISVEYNVEMNTVFDLTKNSVTTYYVGVSIIDKDNIGKELLVKELEEPVANKSWFVSIKSVEKV